LALAQPDAAAGREKREDEPIHPPRGLRLGVSSTFAPAHRARPQDNSKGAAPANFARQLDPTALPLHRPLGDGEPEAMPALGPGPRWGVISVFRWFWWRINAWTELAAIGCGLLCALAHLALERFAPQWAVFGAPWHELRFEIKLALFTAIVLPVSLVATYLSAPVSRAKLEVFYRKVRPGGWWQGIDPALRQLPQPALTARTFVDMGWGVCLCIGASLGIGYAMLLQPIAAGLSFLLAGAGAIGVHRWLRRECGEAPVKKTGPGQ
jgi:hypothetical protein